MILEEHMKTVWKYSHRLRIAISILFNVILGGKSNQTFSARNWAWAREGKPNLVWLIDRIFWLDPDHCFKEWMFWNELQKHYNDYKFFR
jgi:hypothetical protein